MKYTLPSFCENCGAPMRSPDVDEFGYGMVNLICETCGATVSDIDDFEDE